MFLLVLPNTISTANSILSLCKKNFPSASIYHHKTSETVIPRQNLIYCLVSGNPLSCNCRLSWVYALRNETKDNTLRHALEKISCITDPIADRHSNQETNDSEKTNVLSDDSYDYYDKNAEYDNNEAKTKTASKKLTDIPLDTLPCPKEIMQSIEESYGHPVQNEIRLKAFSAAARNAANSILATLLAKIMLKL
jgi:hypothetical protein